MEKVILTIPKIFSNEAVDDLVIKIAFRGYTIIRDGHKLIIESKDEIPLEKWFTNDIIKDFEDDGVNVEIME